MIPSQSNSTCFPFYGLKAKAEDVPVVMSFETGCPGNLFDAHGTISGTLTVTPVAKKDENARLLCCVTEENRTLWKQSFSVSLAGEQRLSLSFPVLDGHFGVFRLAVTLYRETDGMVQQVFGLSRGRLPGKLCPSVGVSVHIFSHNRASILEMLAKLGVGSLRDEIAWGRLERERGVFTEFPAYTAATERTLALQLQPLMILDYGNSFYDGGAVPYTEEGIAAYAAFCAEVASRYRGKLSHFEIWNEYNLLGFNRDRRTPEEYTRLLKAAFTAIKAVAPEAVVCTAGTCNGHPSWLRRILEAGAYDYCDEIGLHPYCSSQGPVYPDRGGVYEAVEEYRALVRQYGPEKPVLITEIGWHTRCGAGSASQRVQAIALIRNYALGAFAGTPYPVYSYTDSDGLNPFDSESHYGLLESTDAVTPSAPKAAAIAVAAYASLAAEGICEETFCRDGLTGFCISHAAGDRLLLLWATDGAVTVTFETAADQVEVYDLFGNRTVLTARNGRIFLTVDEAPVYLRAADAALSVQPVFPPVSAEVAVIAGEAVRVPLPPETGGLRAVCDDPSVGEIAVCGAALLLQTEVAQPGNRLTLPVFLLNGDRPVAQLMPALHGETAACLTLRPHIDSDTGWNAEAVVKNQSAVSALLGTLNARCGEERFRTAVRAAAGETVSVRLPFRLPEAFTPVTVTGSLLTDVGLLLQEKQRLCGFGIPYRTPVPFFNKNGMTGAWGEPQIRLSREQYVCVRPDIPAEATEAALWLGWDEQYFYLAADVTDPVHAQIGLDGPIWKDIWDGDGLQFRIRCGTGGESEIGLALSSETDDAIAWRWSAPENRSVKRLSSARLRVVRCGEHTQYEAMLCWKDLLPRGVTIGAGDALSFALHINNAQDLVHDLVGYLPFGEGVGCRSAGQPADSEKLSSLVLLPLSEG